MRKRDAYTVKPSLSQKSVQLAFVTRLPDQLCVISCATTLHDV